MCSLLQRKDYNFSLLYVYVYVCLSVRCCMFMWMSFCLSICSCTSWLKRKVRKQKFIINSNRRYVFRYVIFKNVFLVANLLYNSKCSKVSQREIWVSPLPFKISHYNLRWIIVFKPLFYNLFVNLVCKSFSQWDMYVCVFGILRFLWFFSFSYS